MNCSNCGGTQGLEAIRAGECEFCRAPLPHVVDAAAKAAAMNELLADRDGDGIPDALQQLDAAQKRKGALEQTEQRLALLRDRREACANAKVGWMGVAVLTLVLTLVASVAWTGIMQANESDPWFGQFSQVYCPSVCRDCRGPVRYYAPSGQWYCSPKGENLIELHWTEISDRGGELLAYATPSGALPFILASSVIFFPLLAVLIPLVATRRVRKRRAQVAEIDAQIAAIVPAGKA